MRISDLMTKSDDELHAISLQKIKSGPRKGCASDLALKAQKILNHRMSNTFGAFNSSASWARSHTIVQKF